MILDYKLKSIFIKYDMFVFWPNLMVKAACNKIYPKASSLLLILRYLRFFTMSLSSAAADVIFGCAIMADTTDIPSIFVP